MKLTEAQQAKKQEILKEISDLLDNAYEAYEIGVETTIRDVLDVMDYYEEQCTKAEGTWLEMARKDILALKGGQG